MPPPMKFKSIKLNRYYSSNQKECELFVAEAFLRYINVSEDEINNALFQLV